MTNIGLVVPFRHREPRLRRLVKDVVARWQRAHLRRQARRAIMEMDDHMISDLGISRAQALFEIDRWR